MWAKKALGVHVSTRLMKSLKNSDQVNKNKREYIKKLIQGVRYPRHIGYVKNVVNEVS